MPRLPTPERPAPCLPLLLLALWLVLGAAPEAAAQDSRPVYDVAYRPPEARYYEVGTPHFRLIYEEGLTPHVAEAAAWLEGSLPLAAELVGLRRPLRMPVVLNRFNDRSNGYVTPMPFKQEVESTRIRGNTVPPRSPSWFAFVLPHELAHAVHAESGSGIGVGRAIRPFAPDLSRALHFAGPAGIAEGAAVYLESRIAPGAGRLNHPLFEMEFRAAMLSGDPWSLAQMLEASRYTRPFDRHYHGGAQLFAYMAERDRLDFFRRSENFFYRMPLLGYGPALWYGTGRPPHLVGRRLRRASVERLRAEQAARGPLTEPRVLAGGRGVVHRRPLWLDGETLLVYTSGYDLTPGFFRVDASTGRRERVASVQITEDYAFSLSADGSRVLFARYVVDAFAARQAVAELFVLELATGEVRRLTEGARAFAPVEASDGAIWALQNDGPTNRRVRLGADGEVHALAEPEGVYFLDILPAPDGRRTAVLANAGGRQGLFWVEERPGEASRLTPWLLWPEASVFDAAWGPDGRYLLFSADLDGYAGIYAFDTASDRLLRLVRARYGALEPTLSPDGRTLAYVDYRDERYDLVTVPFAPETAEVIPFDGPPAEVRRVAPVHPDVPISDARPYRPLRGLAPRMRYPVLRYDLEGIDGTERSLIVGIGAGVQGVDPLESWAYAAEAFHERGQLWGDLRLTTGTALLRPFARLYRLPTRVTIEGEDGPLRLDRADRGVEAGVRLPVTVESNVHRSFAALGLSGEWRRERYDGATEHAPRPDAGRLRLKPTATAAYRLQANRRDLVPTGGLLLRVSGGTDVHAPRGAPAHWARARADAYLPGPGANTTIDLNAGLLVQNRGAIVDTDEFLPRGREGTYLGGGTHVRLGVEYTQPIWYIDDGFFLVPVYFEALYGFGFGDVLGTLDGAERGADPLGSVGAGLGLQVRLFHAVELDVRVSAVYRPEDGRVVVVAR